MLTIKTINKLSDVEVESKFVKSMQNIQNALNQNAIDNSLLKLVHAKNLENNLRNATMLISALKLRTLKDLDI